jgi:hypothetical protein
MKYLVSLKIRFKDKFSRVCRFGVFGTIQFYICLFVCTSQKLND